MIILTAEQAAKVRGRSPNDQNAAIDPVPLKDGTFMLDEEVLKDPAHADIWQFLANCNARSITENEKCSDEDFKKLILPNWKDAGVRVIK